MIEAAEVRARIRAQGVLAETMETERNRIMQETKKSAPLDSVKTVDEAKEKVNRILEQARAEAEARRIIAEAEHTAKQIIKNADDRAKVEYERVLAEAHGKESVIIEEAGIKALQIVTEAEDRAREIVKEARRHDKVNMTAIESQAEDKAQLMAANQTEKTRQEANKKTPKSQPEPELNDNHANEGNNVFQSEDRGDGEFFQGDVHLILVPPVRLDAMIVLHKRLKQIPDVEVLNVTGSVDKGITIRALAKSAAPLIKLMKELPLVTTAVEQDNQIPGNEAREKQPIRTISITTR